MNLHASVPFRLRFRRCALGISTAFALVASFVGTASRSQAQIILTSTWLADTAIGPSDWSNSLRWLVPPSPGNNVVINNGLLLAADVNQDVNATVSQLTLGPLATLTVGSGRTLDVTASSTITGTLKVATGGTLSLQAAAHNTAGGLIEAQSGSTVAINDATLTGGNLTTLGTAALHLNNATLTGVTVTNSASGVVRALSGVSTLFGVYNDSAGSQMRVSNGAKIVLPGGAGGVTVNGGVYLDSSGGDTVLEIGTAGLTVNGTGKMVLSNQANNRVIGGGTGAAVTLGPGFTVQGAGLLGDGSLGFTNQGSIIADQSTALVVKPSALGFTNSGTLRATSGATLKLLSGVFTNTGIGGIFADIGSHVEISASTIIGGLLTSVGTGHFHAVDSSTLSGVTVAAGSTVEVDNGHALTFTGNSVNDGLVSLLGSGVLTDLKFNGLATVSGAGNIVLGDSPFNRVIAASGGSSLTIGAAQTISGAGQLGTDTLAITNQGTIAATGTNSLILNNAGPTFSNQGTLKATGTGGLALADANVTNQGTVEIAAGSSVAVAGVYTQIGSSSVTKLDGGTLTSTAFALQNGKLIGAGTINGAVTTTGGAEILPGGSGGIGALTFNHTLTMGPSNVLRFDLGGTAPGTGYDRINGADVVLDGSLFLTFTSGFQFTIAPTDTLTLISTSAALSGNFLGIADGSRFVTSDGFGSFQVNYFSNALTLSNFQAIPEPSTWALLGLGSVAVLLVERRRRRRA